MTTNLVTWLLTVLTSNSTGRTAKSSIALGFQHFLLNFPRTSLGFQIF